jgi:hypothetical protein
MRRSTHVVAPILASAAVALLSSCHSGPEMQRCVDQNNHVVDPKFCKNLPQANAQNGQQPLMPYPYPYHFYYGGYGGYGLGSTVAGGGLVPSSGHSYSITSGTSRGGFGSSFGGEEGGGE